MHPRLVGALSLSAAAAIPNQGEKLSTVSCMPTETLLSDVEIGA